MYSTDKDLLGKVLKIEKVFCGLCHRHGQVKKRFWVAKNLLEDFHISIILPIVIATQIFSLADIVLFH